MFSVIRLEDNTLNLTCSVDGSYPRPSIRIIRSTEWNTLWVSHCQIVTMSHGPTVKVNVRPRTLQSKNFTVLTQRNPGVWEESVSLSLILGLNPEALIPVNYILHCHTVTLHCHTVTLSECIDSFDYADKISAGGAGEWPPGTEECSIRSQIYRYQSNRKVGAVNQHSDLLRMRIILSRTVGQPLLVLLRPGDVRGHSPGHWLQEHPLPPTEHFPARSASGQQSNISSMSPSRALTPTFLWRPGPDWENSRNTAGIVLSYHHH